MLKIAYRKNGLYEVLVPRAIEGFEVEHLVLDKNTTGEGIRNLFRREGRNENSMAPWDYTHPDLSDATVHRELFGCVGQVLTLDCIIAYAIKRALSAGSQKELCVDLFSRAAAMMGLPPRVIIVTDNLEDHVYSVKDEADTACQFWTDVIVQAVGTQPTMMSYKEYRIFSNILDWEWVLVDRHVRIGGKSCPWGMVFYIPVENLLESLVTIGIAPSGSWQDSVIEAIRKHVFSKING